MQILDPTLGTRPLAPMKRQQAKHATSLPQSSDCFSLRFAAAVTMPTEASRAPLPDLSTRAKMILGSAREVKLLGKDPQQFWPVSILKFLCLESSVSQYLLDQDIDPDSIFLGLETVLPQKLATFGITSKACEMTGDLVQQIVTQSKQFTREQGKPEVTPGDLWRWLMRTDPNQNLNLILEGAGLDDSTVSRLREAPPFKKAGIPRKTKSPKAENKPAESLSVLLNTLTPDQTDVLDETLKSLIEQGVRGVLEQKGIPAELGETKLTPNSYRILLKGQPKINSKLLMGLHDEFMTCNQAVALDLYNVEPLPGYYALFFKREKRGVVHYADCLKERLQKEPLGEVSTRILLGRRENDSSLVYWDFDKAEPHALCGGMTGSGKSETLTTMIMDLMINNTPDTLELVLLDPKRTEFGKFKGLPHLHGTPVIKDKETAIQVIQGLAKEVEERYKILEQYGVNKISQLPPGVMRRKFLIFDEVARWMADENFKKVIEKSVEDLGNVARAAGVHLILCTQRPDNDVLSPQTRQSLGAKLALKVDRDKNSVIILGEAGAENLMGNGQMIAMLGGETLYLQSAYLPGEHFEALRTHVREATP